MNLTNAMQIHVDGKRAVQVKIGGRVVWGLPDGYSPLDHIETDGETQYLDTGFKPNQDSRIVCEFMYLGGNGIYGTRYSTSARNFALRVINSSWQPGYGATLGSTGIDSDKQWHVADQNKNVFYIDGELGREFEYTTFTGPKTITLGGINANNKFYYGEGRYRLCQIYDNGAIVRNLIPCKNDAGEVGMYDTVGSTFYGLTTTAAAAASEEV